MTGKRFFCFPMLSLTTLLTILTLTMQAQNTNAQSSSVPPEWQTYAEKTAYRETPRYDETIAYSRKLADASPQITLTDFGRSGEGRALALLIADKDGATTPEAVKKRGNLIVLIQGCIHAGESDGKDAGLALLRDIGITKTLASLLDHVTILFIPIYNADGHERFSAYNRINQNGPAQMGWRATTAGLNLNRDYMKADAPETRAWLKLWNDWQPDFFVDCHVTDGADFRYNVTYHYERFANAPAASSLWMARALERVVPATERAGNLLSTYLEFKDNRDFSQGIETFIGTPRFSTGYTPLRNRPGLLIETHMFKDYRSRVRGTYDLLRCMLEEINRDPANLQNANKEADAEALALGRDYDPARRFALQVELTDKTVPFQLKAVESHTELSDVSGDLRVVFGDKPVDLTVPIYKEARVAKAVAPPLYYIVPPQWQNVIEVIAAHGVTFKRTSEPLTIEVETYRFTDVKWSPSSFEGRNGATFVANPVRLQRTFPAGSVIVPVAQTASRLIMNLLEPEAPDSFVAWGFFNAIFEQKEYGENYVVEKLAREMMAADARLKSEFENKIRIDPKFAANPRARLNFFYERSPYWDTEKNLYPVGRIVSALGK